MWELESGNLNLEPGTSGVTSTVQWLLRAPDRRRMANGHWGEWNAYVQMAHRALGHPETSSKNNH
eukprot:10298370-Lingulodinium_polyedra.AAC.1